MSSNSTNTGVDNHSTTSPITLWVLTAIWTWLSLPFLYGRDLIRGATLHIKVSIIIPVAYFIIQSWEDFKDSPRYFVAKVKFLTFYAKYSKRSYLVRFRDSPPQFIANPTSIEVQSYRLNSQERLAVFQKFGIDPAVPSPRRWKLAESVNKRFHRQAPFYQPPPTIVVDLTSNLLRGPRFIQGRALMGLDHHVVMIEEIGRWPGDHHLLVCRGYSWTHDREVHIKMPIHFAATPIVLEEIQRPEGGVILKQRMVAEDFV